MNYGKTEYRVINCATFPITEISDGGWRTISILKLASGGWRLSQKRAGV